jgi:Protein phosphatase 2C
MPWGYRPSPQRRPQAKSSECCTDSPPYLFYRLCCSLNSSLHAFYPSFLPTFPSFTTPLSLLSLPISSLLLVTLHSLAVALLFAIQHCTSSSSLSSSSIVLLTPSLCTLLSFPVTPTLPHPSPNISSCSFISFHPHLPIPIHAPPHTHRLTPLTHLRLFSSPSPFLHTRTPHQDREISRIIGAGGFVNHVGRINGNLNVSRYDKLNIDIISIFIFKYGGGHNEAP